MSKNENKQKDINELLLTNIIESLNTMTKELKEVNRKLETIAENNVPEGELKESVELLSKSIVELRNSLNGFTTKIDLLIRQMNIQMTKWDLVMAQIKKLSQILKTSIEEVDKYISNPIFEGIEDENAQKLAAFLYKNRKKGYTEFPDDIIMTRLGMTPTDLKNAIDYLRSKGWRIEEVIVEEEK